MLVAHGLHAEERLGRDVEPGGGLPGFRRPPPSVTVSTPGWIVADEAGAQPSDAVAWAGCTSAGWAPAS
ncbi:hypothetical protein, partial [Pseudonocardia bannensis]|uniref:hypothetical protein n=1 Tax=Pseudonocardia bannensis TaxID=630973 RepID=UPI001B7D16FA